MPIYEYLCSNCGYHLEELQSMSEQPLTRCPKCKKNTLKKLIGTGGGFIFKGSGFYVNDYKKRTSLKSETAKESRTSVSTSAKGEHKKDTKARKK